MGSVKFSLQHSLRDLKDRHKGADIWVIASGASLDFVDPDFFEGKVTVGVNRVNRKFNCNYIVAKDANGFEELLRYRKQSQFILSRHESGDVERPLNHVDVDHWIFDHPRKVGTQAQSPDLDVIGTDSIVVSYSTITSAMHIAAYLGAANIILCGHDCGAIDGQTSFLDYYAETKAYQSTDLEYFRWLAEIESHSVDLKHALRKAYGVNIHSLNPFINFNLEGHHFESAGSRDQRVGNLTLAALKSEADALKECNGELALRCQRLSDELHALKASRAYRIGRALEKPKRVWRKLLKGFLRS